MTTRVTFTKPFTEHDGSAEDPPDDHVPGLVCIPCGEGVSFDTGDWREAIDPFLERHLPCGEVHAFTSNPSGECTLRGRIRRPV